MALLSRYYPGHYSDSQFQIEKRIVRHSLFVAAALVIVLWLIKLIEAEFNLDLSSWGLHPHEAKGLRGILFSPLIHAGFSHLAANTLPLFILTFTLLFFYRKFAYTIFFLIYLFSGFFVWLAGRDAIHIGASGVIYGLAAFLFLSGILSYNIRLLTISLVVSFLYGGMFWGIFPLQPEVSWESHLWGGLSGFVLAWLFRQSAPYEQIMEDDDESGEDDEQELSENENVGFEDSEAHQESHRSV